MLAPLRISVAGATCLFLAVTLRGESPQFQATFEKALVEIQNADPQTGAGNVLSQFEELLKNGTREDIAESIASTLANPERITVWSAAASLANVLGPDFDRTSILKSVRSSLSHSFTANAPERAAMTSARFLCNYGTPDDVALVKRFATEIKQSNPVLASSLEATLLGRENMIALAKAAESSKANDPPKELAVPKPSPAVQQPAPKKALEVKPTTATPSEEPTSSTPWSIIVVLIVAACGLLWLALKRRS